MAKITQKTTSSIGSPRFGANLLLFLILCLCTLSACSQTTTSIGLIGEQQTIPMPSFYAKDADTAGELPQFAQIRVYELTERCTPPNCPIVWDVVVASKHAPNEFVYGGFPGFGAQTVIPAKPLQPGARYLLVTLPNEYGSPDGRGEFYFRVTEEGRVVAGR